MIEETPINEEVKALEIEVAPLETIVNEGNNSENEIRAERFVDLISHNVDPKVAAKEVGASIESITSRDQFGKAVGKLIGDFALDAEIQKRLVDAGLNKLFIQSVSSKSLKERKHALDVAKQIGQNLGISPPDGGVTIDLGGLGDIIKNVSLDGVPVFEEKNKGKENESSKD